MTFTDPSIASSTLVCIYIFTAVAILFMILQLKVCFESGNFMSPENILTFFAFIVSLALVSQITWAVIDEHQGQHMSEVPKIEFEVIAKSMLLNEALWAFVNTCVRISALIFLRRIFGVIDSARRIITCLMFFSVMYGLAALLIPLLICRPIQASWDNKIAGVCGDQPAAFVAVEVSGLIIDILISILPARCILGLNLSTPKKLQILAVFTAGSLVTIITGLRLAALYRVNSPDFSYDQGSLGLLSTLGSLLGIIFYAAPYLSLSGVFNSAGFADVQLWKYGTVECIGTAMIVFSTSWSSLHPITASSGTNNTELGPAGIYSTSAFIGPLVGGISNWFLLTLFVYLFSSVSGAHLNPTITSATFFAGITSFHGWCCTWQDRLWVARLLASYLERHWNKRLRCRRVLGGH
ncbi:hypothetical protein SUNI508_12646 [Seiridium unicorne]|uniref:Rhodopsin domain-containing protein n=1 Tax=Seiridium unicorne TaxID=138068 RepID=A0ABR2VGH7_9PEZI